MQDLVAPTLPPLRPGCARRGRRAAAGAPGPGGRARGRSSVPWMRRPSRIRAGTVTPGGSEPRGGRAGGCPRPGRPLVGDALALEHQARGPGRMGRGDRGSLAFMGRLYPGSRAPNCHNPRRCCSLSTSATPRLTSALSTAPSSSPAGGCPTRGYLTADEPGPGDGRLTALSRTRRRRGRRGDRLDRRPRLDPEYVRLCERHLGAECLLVGPSVKTGMRSGSTTLASSAPTASSTPSPPSIASAAPAVGRRRHLDQHRCGLGRRRVPRGRDRSRPRGLHRGACRPHRGSTDRDRRARGRHRPWHPGTRSAPA